MDNVSVAVKRKVWLEMIMLGAISTWMIFSVMTFNDDEHRLKCRLRNAGMQGNKENPEAVHPRRQAIQVLCPNNSTAHIKTPN